MDAGELPAEAPFVAGRPGAAACSNTQSCAFAWHVVSTTVNLGWFDLVLKCTRLQLTAE
jgi:hypothetical protein